MYSFRIHYVYIYNCCIKQCQLMLGKQMQYMLVSVVSFAFSELPSNYIRRQVWSKILQLGKHRLSKKIVRPVIQSRLYGNCKPKFTFGMNNFTTNKIQNWAFRALSLTIELPFSYMSGKERQWLCKFLWKMNDEIYTNTKLILEKPQTIRHKNGLNCPIGGKLCSSDKLCVMQNSKTKI